MPRYRPNRDGNNGRRSSAWVDDWYDRLDEVERVQVDEQIEHLIKNILEYEVDGRKIRGLGRKGAKELMIKLVLWARKEGHFQDPEETQDGV